LSQFVLIATMCNYLLLSSYTSTARMEKYLTTYITYERNLKQLFFNARLSYD